MAELVLFRWPLAAAFGRTVPKTKFYEHGNVRTALVAYLACRSAGGLSAIVIMANSKLV